MKFHISLYRWYLSNSRFGDFIDRIYPNELEIKDTTDTDRSASYVDIHLETDSKGQYETLRQQLWFQFSYCEPFMFM
jgi:hypothetical protein